MYLGLLVPAVLVADPALSLENQGIRYEYDAAGRLIAVKDGRGFASTYVYDRANNRSQVVSINQFQTAFEAENLHHQIGYAEGSGWAATVQHPYGAMVYGPYSSTTPAGQRVGTFRILVDNVNADNSSVVQVDVYDATAGQVVAQRIISRGEWAAPWTYQVFELPFDWSTRAGHLIELRVWYLGTSHVNVDKVGYY
ncbi:MAG: RHS repeat protein [Pseudomonadota bacterium]|nr:RHS repeat protein [Pseudomonadota bacterium]